MSKLDTLKRHQAWRRGSDEPMGDPKEIGEAIDYAIAACEDRDSLQDGIISRDMTIEALRQRVKELEDAKR